MQTYVSVKELHVIHAIALDDQPEHVSGGSGQITYHLSVCRTAKGWQDEEDANP